MPSRPDSRRYRVAGCLTAKSRFALAIQTYRSSPFPSARSMESAAWRCKSGPAAPLGCTTRAVRLHAEMALSK